MNNYQAFISFSLSETVDGENRFTKSFFFGDYLSSVLNNLLQINTYFCDKNLENREKPDFKKEIDDVITNTNIFLLILFNIKDYTNKYYFAEERLKYLQTHQDNAVIYILCNNETFKEIYDSPVKELINGDNDVNHAEVFNVDDVDSFEKMLRTINNYILKEQKIVNNIKICRNCLKIFHDGNDEGTLCCHHGLKNYQISKSRLVWSCCNKEEHFANPNQLINYSPGCITENHHVFKD